MKSSPVISRESVTSHGAVLFQKQSRSAFTLIEVLITTVLTATLMWGIWGVMGTYLDLFNRGEEVAELSQLVRGLTQQLQSDLESVSPTQSKKAESAPKGSHSRNSSATESVFSGSATTSKTSSETSSGTDSNQKKSSFQEFNSANSSSSVQFGMVGSSRNLRLDVIQLVPFEDVPDEEIESTGSEENKYRPKVPELRTVLYTFEKGREWSPEDNEPPPGFIRREMSWEEYLILKSYSSEATDEEDAGFQGEDLQYDKNWPGNDKTVIWVPEIFNMKFRYFNGEIWLGQWNSYATHSLPVAVEVVFTMETSKDRKLRKNNYVLEESDFESDDDESSEDDMDDLEPVELQTAEGTETEAESMNKGSRPLFRQVIYLPMGKHKKTPLRKNSRGSSESAEVSATDLSGRGQ
jgi:type II secretory pathway pseudopilin PulG